MKMNQNAPRIREALTPRARFEALAEECTELAQACLKMCRVISGENPTPKTVDECIDNLKEEALDVISCMIVCSSNESYDPEWVLNMISNNVKLYAKWDKWAKRLGVAEEAEDNADT